MGAPVAKLTYFNTTGLGEAIRLLLAHGGINFEDCRVRRGDFLATQDSLPVGQLPVLEIDGLVLYQSTAICRYLGRKLGLAGDSEREAVLCDIMADNLGDVKTWLSMVYHEPHEEAREMKRELVMARASRILDTMEQEAAKHPGHLVSEKLTWVDFLLAGISAYLGVMAGSDLLATRPGLRAAREHVLSLPGVQPYLASTPGKTPPPRRANAAL